MPRDSDSLILQLYTRTPAPCRDYCGLTVKNDEVVLNIWNITYGPHVYPKRQRRSLEDFLQDKYFQSEVQRLFGGHVLEYVASIAKREKGLRNLPEKVFLRILNYLALKDILNLSQTSKIMFEVIYRCSTDKIWKILFRKYFKRPSTLDDAVMAETFGWRDALKQKIGVKQPKRLRSKAKVPAKASRNNLKDKQNQGSGGGDKNVFQNNVKNKNCAKQGIGSKIITNELTRELYRAQSKNAELSVVDKNNQIVVKGNNNNNISTTLGSVNKIHNIIDAKPKVVNEIYENVRTKINNTKSSSILVTPKTPTAGGKIINHTKSAANINIPLRTRTSLSGRKFANAEIKIDIPKPLKESAACNLKPKAKSATSKNIVAVNKCKMSPPKK